MKLIADSGSTKTSWCLSGENGFTEYFSTGGLNPFFRNTEDIANELREKLIPKINAEVDGIYFYGAGIINEEKGNIVRNALFQFFPKAKIEVQSDLLAAARATLGIKKGIACILGTGSNSCLYNGAEIIEHVPPLGFILGDEGSGAVIGRKLVGDFLKGIMPENISDKFKNQFQLTYADFLEGVYKKEKPNKFLSQFVPFVKENIADEYCINLVENSFEEFIKRNIFRYSGFRGQPICFVGSVAFHFQDQLKNVLKKNHLQFNLVLKEPLKGLLKFHINK
ncbi:MAG TPA: BadF/BadG/BcrA/BcrD ATPase family protein [Draconibacterium sp.]|nr:BadF/BadG/BcrA/BcrD ATPase family protein [Draconibacterium sp.]